MKPRIAKFAIGQVVKHRKYPFRGIVYDVDQSSRIPRNGGSRSLWKSGRAGPAFLSSLCRNADTEYVAYVSEQNLMADTSGDPMRHPQVDEMFVRALDGAYKSKPRASTKHLPAAVLEFEGDKPRQQSGG